MPSYRLTPFTRHVINLKTMQMSDVIMSAQALKRNVGFRVVQLRVELTHLYYLITSTHENDTELFACY